MSDQLIEKYLKLKQDTLRDGLKTYFGRPGIPGEDDIILARTNEFYTATRITTERVLYRNLKEGGNHKTIGVLHCKWEEGNKKLKPVITFIPLTEEQVLQLDKESSTLKPKTKKK